MLGARANSSDDLPQCWGLVQPVLNICHNAGGSCNRFWTSATKLGAQANDSEYLPRSRGDVRAAPAVCPESFMIGRVIILFLRRDWNQTL